MSRDLADLAVISKARWDSASANGYTRVISGQRYILVLDRYSDATVLVPVTVE